MKLSIKSAFQGYRSDTLPYNIPFDTLCAGSYNVQVIDGYIRERKRFRINELIGYNSQRPMGAAAYENVGTSFDKYRFLVQKEDSTTTSTYEVIKFDAADTASLTSMSPASIGGTLNMKYEFHQKTLYLSDGSATPYKYFIDGTTDYFEPQGLPVPTKPSSIAYSTTGGSGGFYNVTTGYVVSFVYKVGSDYEWEGPASSATNVSTDIDSTGSVSMTLTQPLANNAQSHITHFRIYRKHGTLQNYYVFVEDVAVTGTGSTQSYTDDDGDVYDDTILAFEINEFGNQFNADTQLTDAHYGIRWHKGCMFYSSTDGTKLWFSMPGLPESVPATNFFIVGGSNDPFTELISTREALYIVKKFSIWALYGENISDFTLEKVASWGSYLPNMTFAYFGYLYGANQQGIWRWNAQSPPEYITRSINRDFKYNSTYWPSRSTQTYTALDYAIDDGLTQEELSRFRWAVDKETGYLWFDCARDDDVMLGCYVYDPVQGRFMGKFSFPHEALTNLQISEGSDYILSAYLTSNTPVYSWCIYNNILGNSTAVFNSDWTVESSFYAAARFGGYYTEELKSHVTLNYGMIKTNFTGTVNLSMGSDAQTYSSIKTDYSATATNKNIFDISRSSDSPTLLIERLDNFLMGIYELGVDVIPNGVW